MVWARLRLVLPVLVTVGLAAAHGETPTPLEPFAITRFRTAAAVSEKFLREFDSAPGPA